MIDFTKQRVRLVKLFIAFMVLEGSLHGGSLLFSKTPDRSQMTMDQVPQSITVSAPLFSKKSFVFWNPDKHQSPTKDLRNLLEPLGVRILARVMPVMPMKVLRTAVKYLDTLRDDPDFESADAFVCFHPVSNCEVFMTTNKSLIIVSSTRYELHRTAGDQWHRLNANLARIASDSKNVVGANNRYDLDYIRYFTGIESLQLLPNYCGYTNASYTPTQPEYLLSSPARPSHHASVEFPLKFLGNFTETCLSLNCTVRLVSLRSRYSHYRYTDLAAHRGIVHVPYQVSTMSLFEQYRMNIPLFFPSLELLTNWQHEHVIMAERTWDGVNGRKPRKSNISAHPSQRHLPDPNDEYNRTAIEFWLRKSDFYFLPHVTFYDSAEDLVRTLQAMTVRKLGRISEQMKAYNARDKEELLRKWREILKKIAIKRIITPTQP